MSKESISKNKEPTTNKSKLCPFKKITERDQDGYKGKTVLNERFAPCARDRCMAYRPGGTCARTEGNK